MELCSSYTGAVIWCYATLLCELRSSKPMAYDVAKLTIHEERSFGHEDKLQTRGPFH